MIRLLLVVGLLICNNIIAQTTNNSISIIPLPNNITIGKGYFTLNNLTTINYTTAESKKLALLLQEYLQVQYNLNIKITEKATNNCIQFITNKKTNNEAYDLVISTNKIEIIGYDAGLFYGYQSLLQLLPVTIKNKEILLPIVTIKDTPRFEYRGMHLDVCRHMFPLSFLKKYIDILASYKLNVFHWHLTDDQGWRLEIKKYPKLTSIGAYRNQTLIGNYRTVGEYDNTAYGGFYTQEQAKELVAYARERFVTIIPEIEMPGHALAALAAYPTLGCGDKTTNFQTAQTWGVFDDVFCAGKEETFELLQNVIDEVIEIFPSKYIHIGGDECPKTKWKTCSSCQKRIKDNNLKDEHELQSYFIQRMEKYINNKGRKIIGWDEILEGGLAANATVMSWRGDAGGIAAANQNHDVIMTPASYGLYFDHKQGADRNREPLSIGGLSTLEKVYLSNPIPAVLEPTKHKFIKGVQANVWTEYIATTNKVEFTIYPRIFALAEIAWTSQEHKNWTNFSQTRVANHLAKLDKTNTFYRVPEVYGLKDTIIYASEYIFKNLTPSVEGAKIYYTIDDYNPSALDNEFINEVKITVPPSKERIFKAIVVTPAGKTSNYVKAVIINSKN
ncbi:MAG TPA: family 20 glycosylhydrolase [Chitinophagaceae bacterium]|nr:family 20 glycosylhydrolase [Chitinophagaceae bacterium]HNM34476.1 family 20 glycosylhydrolase [Chitinophagaceae bacterium]HNN31742.1 family 20 glycosylhydrolase [Chitinophagaceae bacterium]